MTRPAASSLIATTLAVVAMLWLGTSRTYSAATLLPPGEQCFQSTSPTSGGLAGPLAVLGTVSGGAGYTNNIYTNVLLTGGSGFGATANITVAGNVVTNVTIVNPGSHYAGGDTLSATTASLGGAGSGFSVPVSSVTTTGTGMLGLLGTIVGGSGGVAGTYPGVALTGGSGSGAAANITVAAGIVTAVAITNPGLQYQVGDTLSASSGSIGGVTGFSIPVSSVTVNSALAGGQVFMYVPNTVTFKQTWKNAGQTILNTNPITLDQNGCAIIYGTGTYRQVLQDSLGNTVWDQITTDTSSQENVFWAGTAGGTANAITLVDPGFNATDGSVINFTALASNTGATTINPSGFGPINVLKDTTSGPESLTGGEIIATNPISVIYRLFDSSFHILNLIPNNLTQVLVTNFGAQCDGTTDDTIAIQSAINSLATSGGIVNFPVATCEISNTLHLGNGTTTSVSSRNGIQLVGLGNPNGPNNLFFGGASWPVTNGPKLRWKGASALPMITVNGPLQGWGVNNLFLDCNSIATVGLNPVSAMYGSSQNLTIINCTSAGILSTSNPLGGYSALNKADSLRNTYINTYIFTPSTIGARGVDLEGAADGSSNTDYNTFINTIIGFASNNSQIGIYLGVTDSNTFFNASIAGMQATQSGIFLDYTINNNFPLSNNFYSLEVQGGTPYNTNGSPGLGSKNNYVFGAVEANGGTFPNIKTGFASPPTSFAAGTWNSYTPNPQCGTATFTVNSARDTAFGKTTYMNLDLTITAIGTCGNTFTFTPPLNASFTGGLAGVQTVGSAQVVTCYVSAATATCIKAGGAAFSVNDNIKISGVYEAL